jgi:DNA repair protein RecO (recombination protein O)
LSLPAEFTDALVLRAVDYGEADRIVTLLTRQHGRISAIARAARKSKRRFAGSLEGFAVVSAELAFGRGALARLASARVTRSFSHLLAELARMEAAGAILRLTRDLVPEHVPDPIVFEGVCELLALLDDRALSPRPVQLAGQAQLLALTGFAPQLGECTGCGRIPGEGQPALFDPVRGGIVCRACGGGPLRLSSSVRTQLELAFAGHVREAAEAAWSEAELREAERALLQFIARVLPQE